MTPTTPVVAGIDTHSDTHHVAVMTLTGVKLADRAFPARKDGYMQAAAFVRQFGQVQTVGVEGANSYGAGIARHLRQDHFTVAEVIRPKRQVRRMKGKTDPIDAYEAAKAVLAEDHLPVPKTADGPAEAIRQILAARASAVKAHTACWRALRHIARRAAYLEAEIEESTQELDALVKAANPALVAAKGFGTVTAAQLLVTAGDNPGRLGSEAAFAALTGTAPLPASSGKTTRHRLNRGGDRQANQALHRIALVRMATDQRTKDYIAKLTAAGKTVKEAIRCLKRAIAREAFKLLVNPPPVPASDDLRPLRKAAGLTLETAAQHLGTWPVKLSRIERGLARDDTLTEQYRAWLKTRLSTT
jgi:transposase